MLSVPELVHVCSCYIPIPLLFAISRWEIAYIVDQDQNVGLNRPATSDFRRTLLDDAASIGSHQIAHVGSGMKAHVEPSCHLVFSVCGYRRGCIIMWSYSEISAERSQAFWKRLNLGTLL